MAKLETVMVYVIRRNSKISVHEVIAIQALSEAKRLAKADVIRIEFSQFRFGGSCSYQMWYWNNGLDGLG